MITAEKVFNELSFRVKMKYCSNYTGVNCINGNCPIARSEDYSEYGIDIPKNCIECSYYKGCEDCAWFETGMCKETAK